jgi:hypothetical protein
MPVETFVQTGERTVMSYLVNRSTTRSRRRFGSGEARRAPTSPAQASVISAFTRVFRRAMRAHL